MTSLVTAEVKETQTRSWRSWRSSGAADGAIIATVAFAVYSTYAIACHQTFLTAGYDLGIFDQAVRAYSHLQAPIVTLKGVGFNLLGDHFHPILVLLAPLYWIWDDPRVLLLAQAALLAWSVVVVWTFAREKLGRSAAVLVGVAYAFTWALQQAVAFDFHEIAFAPPILAHIILELDRRRYGRVAVWCVALLLVREDMGLVVAMVGVILALRGRLRVALRYVAAGALTFLVVTRWFIPALSPTGTFGYWSYTAIGATAFEALRTVVTRPWKVVEVALTPVTKAWTLVTLFSPYLFLSFLSPYLLLAVPLLLGRFLSYRESLWTTWFQYSMATASIIAMAAVDGLVRLQRRHAFPAIVSALCVAVMAFVPVIGTAAAPRLYPFSRIVTGAAFHGGERAAAIRDALTYIPDGVWVEVDDRIAPHLTSRTSVTLPGRSDGKADWMILDLDQLSVGDSGPSPWVFLENAPGAGFRTVFTEHEIVVLRRGPVDPEALGSTQGVAGPFAR